MIYALEETIGRRRRNSAEGSDAKDIYSPTASNSCTLRREATQGNADAQIHDEVQCPAGHEAQKHHAKAPRRPRRSLRGMIADIQQLKGLWTQEKKAADATKGGSGAGGETGP